MAIGGDLMNDHGEQLGHDPVLYETHMKCEKCGARCDFGFEWGGKCPKAETDPTGANPHEPGAKLDAGKIPAFRGLIDYFPHAILHVAEVSNKGAQKYAWKGWESVPDGFNRYSDAMVRHLIAESDGAHDEDTGCLHAAQVAWNALARLELMVTEKRK